MTHLHFPANSSSFPCCCGGLNCHLETTYTFSKLIDQATGPFAGEALGAGAVQVTNSIQNFSNLRAERALSALDSPHRFVVNGIWQLPVGKNHRWKLTPTLAAIFGDWEIAGIAIFQTGGPITITSASNTTFSLGGNQRPNLSGISPALSKDEQSLNRWFNTAAFSAPAPFTFGNSPRTLGEVRADGLGVLDMSLAKGIPVTEKVRLVFRSEFFNLLNTARFAPPNTSFGSPQFGNVTNQANQPRVIQFALKVVF